MIEHPRKEYPGAGREVNAGRFGEALFLVMDRLCVTVNIPYTAAGTGY
jgi:hypothetical protein